VTGDEPGAINHEVTGVKACALELSILFRGPRTGVPFAQVFLDDHNNVQLKIMDACLDMKDDLKRYFDDLVAGVPCFKRYPRETQAMIFNHLFKTAELVPYRQEWGSPLGYFSGAVWDTEEQFSNRSFLDPKGRRGVVLWDVGTSSKVVVFERFPGIEFFCFNALERCVKPNVHLERCALAGVESDAMVGDALDYSSRIQAIMLDHHSSAHHMDRVQFPKAG
jgi:hypothetical protein